MLFFLRKLIFLALLFINVSSCIKHENRLSEIEVQKSIIQIYDSIGNNLPFSRHLIDSTLRIVKDSSQKFELLNLKANCLIMDDSFDLSLHLVNKNLNSYSHIKDLPQSGYLYALSYNIKGLYYTRMGYMDTALYYFKKAYETDISKEKRRKFLDICINIADTYLSLGDYPNSARYFRKALFEIDSLQISSQMGFPVYFGLGQVYLNLRDFQQSDYYFKLAEKDFDKRTLNEKFTFCNNRGNYYYYHEEYPIALQWFKKARKVLEGGKYIFCVHLCELNMSDVYLHLNNLDSASNYAEKCSPFFEEIKHRTALYYLATIKGGIALKRNNPNLAYQYFKNNSDTSGIENDMKLIRNKLLQEYYYQKGDFYNAYQFLNKNNAIEKNLQSERVKGRAEELNKRYQQDTTLLKRDIVITHQNESIKNMKLSRYILILIVFLIVLISFVVYWFMRKQRDLANLKHINDVSLLRMQNTRNRISPHFIFNVLNHEINSSISEHNKTDLMNLTKLIRKSLELSDKMVISIEEELEFVKNYIELECLSFGDEFNLIWEVDSTVNLSEIKIPAMMLQISIENAIKHALRGLEGEKVLKISIFKVDKGIKINVEDNGNGYNPGYSQFAGTGTGLKVIYQTISILNSKNKNPIQYKISDKMLDKSMGTKVEMFIPSEYRYVI